MTRLVRGKVEWARALEGRPSCIPQGRPRGAKRQGVLYERWVAEQIPSARWGQWFEYADAEGVHYCQTDAILPFLGGIVCLEVKLGWTPAAEDQLFGLYLPVLRTAASRPAWGVVVCKYLRGTDRQVFDSLDLALAHGGRDAPVWCLDPRVALRAPIATSAVGQSVRA